jgi:hypothetical protein
MAAIVAVVSDTHINSTIGLCPPRVQLDDGGTYRPSRFQRELWRCWGEFWGVVQQRREGLPLFVVLNGDLVDGDHHDTSQLVSRNLETQARMAVEVLDPMAQMADQLFVIRGTEAHTGPSAMWEEFLGRDLGAVGDDIAGTASWWWLPLEVDGVRFDFAHHPGTSSRRPWTRGGAANRLAAWVLNDYAEAGDRPPHLVFRSHNHVYEDSGNNHAVRAIITPCWQLTTGFGHRVGGSGKLADIGGVIVECQDGHYQLEVQRYRPRRRKSWRATSG